MNIRVSTLLLALALSACSGGGGGDDGGTPTPDVSEWEGMQGGPSHTGYMPLVLNPEHFKKAWEWQHGEPSGRINPVATADGKVYISSGAYRGGAGALVALSGTDGREVWMRSLGGEAAVNPPGVANGTLFVATTGNQDAFLWAFDAASGNLLHKSQFESQWFSLLAPTVYADQVFTNGGYNGGGVYAFSIDDGAQLWNRAAGDDDMGTPAVDEQNVYYYSGTTLEIWDRLNGDSVASIVDPSASLTGYSYHGAPILGSRGNVLAFSGSTFSGRGNSSAEHFDQRVISSFNIEEATFEWASAHAYLTTPAVADGAVYAARNDPMQLDALDEATGELLWSWAPNNSTDTEFHRNIVVTSNLLFVSTNSRVHAVDLATRKSVWRYPEPGMLAISADKILYIATGARESDGKLVAVNLAAP